ncbi:MAG: hypothetical protein KF886_07080 [Candidatus Hydrogenedentes bacterium]|nr:hypothetical protein [Candidatus Hydrogenedentota bacterium]
MTGESREGSDTARRGGSRTMIAVCLGLAALPALALLYKLYHYGLYFPYWDAWHFALFLEKAAGEGVGLADFWAQHNEHRSVFPRLVMYALASLSGWNVAWELAANVLLATATLLLLARAAWLPFPPGERPWWLIPLFAFLVYSWAQMENWIWGWQIHVFLNVAAVVFAALLLSGPQLTPLRFAASIFAVVVASFSFANGLLAWIALAPLVLLRPGIAREARIIYSLLWIAAGLLVIQLYLIDYAKPGVSPSIGAVLRAPRQFLGFVVLYLGAPITGLFTRLPWHGVALPAGPLDYLAGAVGLLALPLLAARLYRNDRASLAPMLPWAGLALYVLGSAAVTAAGRAALGLDQAMTSRYTTITTLYWCALAALVALHVRAFPVQALDCPRRRRVYGALASGLFLAFLLASLASQRAWEQNARWKQMGWEALRAGHLAPLYLQDLCWDPVELRDRFLPILRERQLAGFGGENRPVALADRYVDEAERFVEAGLLIQAKTYLETALILDESHERARLRYQELREAVEKNQ